MGAKYTPAQAGTRGIFVAALFLALALVCGATEAGTILIDDFTQPSPRVILQFPWPAGTNQTQAFDQNANVIGGRRETTYLAFGTDPGPDALTGSIGMVGSTNKLQVGSVSDTIAPIATLLYRGASGDIGANLIDGTNDRIQMQFWTVDAQPAPLGLDVKIEVFSPGGTSKTLTKDAQNFQGQFTVDFPFAQFVGNGDLANVDFIRITYNDGRRTPNIDYEVRAIAAVPEPTGLLIMAIGGALIGAASIGRRKSKRLPSVLS